MKLKLNIPKIGLYLALFIIGYLNITAMLWDGGSTSLLISLAMLIVAAIALVLFAGKPIPTQNITLAIFCYYIYIVIICLFNGYLSVFVGEPTMIVTCAYWVFCFWLFYYCGNRESMNHKTFLTFFSVLMVICFILFCRYYAMNLETGGLLSGLNIVYYLLFMFPIVLMSTNKKVLNIGIAINILATLLSSKRGAFIILFFALLLWMLTDLSGKLTTKKLFKIILYVCVTIVIVSLARLIVDKLELNIFDRMETFISGEDSGGSGRSDIWSDYWEVMREDSILHNLFGRGYNATKLNPEIKGLGLSWAHNDFLQIVFDYGIVGFIIFMVVVAKLFITAGNMKKFGYRYYRQFLISLFIFVLCCVYSMVTIYPQWFLTMVAFWGIVIGDFDRERKAKAQ